MKNPFNQVALNEPRRNQFDLSHERKQTQQMGDLVPCYLQEVVPGDTFNMNTEILVRFAPMLAPLMHRVDVHIHYFYVPNRIIWSEWEDFITGGEDGTELPSFPRIRLDTYGIAQTAKGKLADYLGINDLSAGVASVDLEVSALPFRAYQLIYDEYYRDQNLTDPIETAVSSGVIHDDTEQGKLMTMRKRAWEKDYFTSALPWTQRGAEIQLPLGDTANVNFTVDGTIRTRFVDNAGNNVDGGNLAPKLSAGGTLFNSHTGGATLDVNNADALEVDLSTATAATINDLRLALRLQRWLETSARAGSRYIEQIHAHYGVRVKDYRLQRPEFLGGGKTPVQVSEVLNQYQDQSNANDTPVGEMFGHAISFGEQNGFNAFFPEHGYIIGICSIVPRTNYQNGLHRHWHKFDKFDFYFPEFAHLGEQEVKVKELYYTHVHADNEETFGYQQRFAEYKYNNSTIHGDFRDDFDYWHLGRKFTSKPVLNTSFIECNPDQRIFAVTDTSVHKCWVSMYHKISAQRPIPYFAIPSI